MVLDPSSCRIWFTCAFKLPTGLEAVVVAIKGCVSLLTLKRFYLMTPTMSRTLLGLSLQDTSAFSLLEVGSLGSISKMLGSDSPLVVWLVYFEFGT